MSPKRLKSNTTAFKLAVVEKVEIMKNRAAGREFGHDKRCVRRWRSEKADLQKMPKLRKARKGIVVHWSILEPNLTDWVRGQRKSGFAVSTVQIRLQARVMASKMQLVNFKGGSNRCFQFIAWNKLSLRARTIVAQKLPDDWEDKKSSLLNFVKSLIEGKSTQRDKS